MMSLNRWLMSLATVGISTSTVLQGSAHANAPESRDESRASLPQSVHQKANGRYVRDLCDHRQRLHCIGKQLLPESWQPGDPFLELSAPSPPPTLSVSIIEAAYNIPSTAQANGKIVAVLGAPDNQVLTDLAMYRSTHGLPAMERCNGLPLGTGAACFAQVAQDGGVSTNKDSSLFADGETSLDTDMVSLGCPDCSILFVEIDPSYCESDVLEGVATAARLGASAISISLGGPEATDPNALSVGKGGATNGTSACPAEADWRYDAPGPFSTPGHLVFVSAGDYGYDDAYYSFAPMVGGAAPSYPASSPYVIAVGGTALNWSASSSGEGIWDHTTSGCSTEFAMPPWQAPLLSGSSCQARATADVSAMATFFSEGQEIGIDIVVHGQTMHVTGTSASSPLVAGIFTRLGLTTAMSNDLSWVYKNMSAFNDLGSPAYPLPSGASNTNAPSGSSCGILCAAGIGWDGPSGVGSPNGTNLAAAGVGTADRQPYPESGLGHFDWFSVPAAPGGCDCSAVNGVHGQGSLAIRVGLLLAFLGARRRRAQCCKCSDLS